jgi:hypothetical protein
VVSDVRAHTGATVLVMDDGSADETAGEARLAGAEVLRLPFNCGIGIAVQAGFAFGVAEGFDIIARVDGDGQHVAADLPLVMAPVVEERADFCVGSRFLSGSERDPGSATFRSSFSRRLGIRWFKTLLRLVAGRSVTDPTSGFCAANRRAAAILAGGCASDYPEVDAVVLLSRAGLRLTEVPARMRDRQGGASSISGLAPLRYMIKVTMAVAVTWSRGPAPAGS